MNDSFNLISFIIALTVNLFLFGALVAIGIAAAFRLAKNMSARARCLIAVAAFLIAALVPFLVTLQAASKSGAVSKPMATINFPSVLKPVAAINFPEESGGVEKSLSPANPTIEISIAESSVLDGVVDFISDSQVGKVFFTLWLLMAVALLLREFIGHLLLARRRKRLRPADLSWREKLGWAGDVRLYLGEMESPATIGLFRPVIILPANFPAEISDEMTRLILRHEMSHARWRDPLVNAGLRIIQAVFWMSPALWFIGRVIRDEQEAAADHDALASFPNQSKTDSVADYAGLLLAIARSSDSFSPPPPSGAITRFGGSSRLEDRVRRLFTEDKKTNGARLSLAISVLLMSFSGMAFLPAVSFPNRINEAWLVENIVNEDFPANNSINQNPTPEFENESDNNLTEGSNRIRKTVDQTKKNNDISPLPTPSVKIDQKPKPADLENNEKSTGEVIPPTAVQEAVPAVPPVRAQDVVNATNVISATPVTSSCTPQNLKDIPKLPKVANLPEIPKIPQLKSVLCTKPK